MAVYWRGRVWRIAGGSGEGEPGASAVEEGGGAEALWPSIAEQESDAAAREHEALTAECERLRVRIAELEPLQTRVDELERARSESADQALAHLRRALLAEHAGQLVPELLVGATVEALEASVEAAKAAHARILEQAREQLQARTPPAGAGARTGEDLSALSPTDKIARGLLK